MGAAESRALLERIERSERQESAADIVRFFDSFDTDRSGRLEGYEAANLVEFVSQYIVERLHDRLHSSVASPASSSGSAKSPSARAVPAAAQPAVASTAAASPRRLLSPVAALLRRRNPDAGSPCCAPDFAPDARALLGAVRSWVQLQLDANRDGIVERAEIVAHLPRILDCALGGV